MCDSKIVWKKEERPSAFCVCLSQTIKCSAVKMKLAKSEHNHEMVTAASNHHSQIFHTVGSYELGTL